MSGHQIFLQGRSMITEETRKLFPPEYRLQEHPTFRDYQLRGWLKNLEKDLANYPDHVESLQKNRLVKESEMMSHFQPGDLWIEWDNGDTSGLAGAGGIALIRDNIIVLIEMGWVS